MCVRVPVAVVVYGQCIERALNHHRVQMTAFTRVDLYRRCACGTDAVGIVGGLLVAFNHGNLCVGLLGFQ